MKPLYVRYADNQPCASQNLLPDFSNELIMLLTEAGESELAAQINELEIVTRCSCGDEFCASFYTAQKPAKSYELGHKNLSLKPKSGMIILDLVDDRIVNVEVINRQDVRDQLETHFPEIH